MNPHRSQSVRAGKLDSVTHRCRASWPRAFAQPAAASTSARPSPSQPLTLAAGAALIGGLSYHAVYGLAATIAAMFAVIAAVFAAVFAVVIAAGALGAAGRRPRRRSAGDVGG